MSGSEVPIAGYQAPEPLTPGEFAHRFQGCSRVLWTVAAGVLGSAGEVEDVLQEAALMALGKLDHFEPGTNFTAWAARFVQNVARNHLRKSVRRRTHATDPEDLVLQQVGGDDTPQERLAARLPVDARGELREENAAFDDSVMAGLNELGPVPRSCLLLRSLLELSYGEISRVLEIPEGTAMSHVHRARAAMRAKLAEGTEVSGRLGTEAG